MNNSTRREFLGRSAAATVAATTGSLPLIGKESASKPADAETLVTTLYKSLNDEQREKICIPFDDPLRHKIENNWHIVPQRVGKFFDKDQQAITREIFLGIHSDEYRDKIWEQFIGDNRNKKHKTPEETFGEASVAIFGKPGEDKFEFVLTGRHCTRRCDGNSTEGVSFGGPIFYGHAAQGFNEKPDHPGNVYWFQAQRANEVYQMLDGKQQAAALKDDSRGERGRKTIELKGHAEGLEGARVGDMTADQKEGIKKVLADLLLPFRKVDREEALKQIEPQFDDLHLAFYQNEDVGNDKTWDTWQLEGPSMIWYFRGDPHVHTWVNIEQPKGDPFAAGEGKKA
ncbi:MAG: DUF3500 domain-containing protein [Verrucomicrobiales bacterium]|nr:DUF3500 domain-containing protein [Verrucomicrobiales bacterium]